MKIDLFQFMILAMKLELQKSTAKSHELVWLYIRNNCHIHFVGLKNTSKFQKIEVGELISRLGKAGCVEIGFSIAEKILKGSVHT